MAKKREKSDTLVYCLSLLLFLFGLCGVMASSTLSAAMSAFTDDSNAVTFITESEVVTETGRIPVQDAAGIVHNFLFVCYFAMTVATVIASATLYRHFKK